MGEREGGDGEGGEGGREGWREGGMEGGMEGRREGGREGGREIEGGWEPERSQVTSQCYIYVPMHSESH